MKCSNCIHANVCANNNIIEKKIANESLKDCPDFEDKNLFLRTPLPTETETCDDKLKQVIDDVTMIIDIGYDYEGFEKSEDLKELIDELVDYAKKAKMCLKEYLNEVAK